MRQRLGVNVDHIATIRQARRAEYPDPVEAALIAETAGADQITVHLREDRRHIQDRDVEVLRRVVKTELNLEMAATEEMVAIARRIRPETVTLVPERREELTTEGGLDVVHLKAQLQPVVASLRDAGIRVSMFIGPDLAQIEASHDLGAHAIELHTGRYCETSDATARAEEFARIEQASKAGVKIGVGVVAGHGLNYVNVTPIAALPDIVEL
ncbi:MAG: pyridoxine 5'-phosphate synthase, partial [Myxococcota bacterium]